MFALQGVLVRITEDTEQKEFIVSTESEFARVSTKQFSAAMSWTAQCGWLVKLWIMFLRISSGWQAGRHL